MKWLIVVLFMTASGNQYTDNIELSEEISTERQCQAVSMPVLAMWANAQPGEIQIVKFFCIPDDGRGRI